MLVFDESCCEEAELNEVATILEILEQILYDTKSKGMIFPNLYFLLPVNKIGLRTSIYITK